MRAKLYEIDVLLSLFINYILNTSHEFILNNYASVWSVRFSSAVGLGHQIDEIRVCAAHWHLNGFNLFLPFDIATSLFLDIDPTVLIEILKNTPNSVVFDTPLMWDVYWLLVVNQVVINNFYPFLYTYKLVIDVWFMLALKIFDFWHFLQNFGTYRVLWDALDHYLFGDLQFKLNYR